MILIVVKFEVMPEYVDSWLDLTRSFTEATRAEPGNIFYEWNRSVEEPGVFTLIEAFQDDAAEAHVSSDHFAKAMVDMKPALRSTPRIISRTVDGSGWDEMGELKVD